jgi:mycofactocin biosynthetic radical S-adenosylmethionine protein MftC
MFLSNKIRHKKLYLLKPDYIQKKDGRYLLIWKNIPYWLIVDGEFYQFLTKCHGGQSVEIILTDISGKNYNNRKLLTDIQNLISIGILTDKDGAPKSIKANNPKTTLIENIAINITRKCNLRCAFCYNIHALTKNTDHELTCTEIISFLQNTQPFLSKNPSLAIAGGEPLEFPEKVLTIANYAKKHRFIPLVSTNGIQITDEFARQAKKVGIDVQVSIDGHNAETNDVVRGKGSFEKAIKGIRTLVKNGTYTTLSLVCHSGNLKYLQNFYEMADSLGVNEARFIPLKKIGGGLNCQFQPVDTLDIIKETISIFTRNQHLRKLMGRDCFTILANTCRYSSKKISCGIGLQTLLLDSDGTIYPCLNTLVETLRIANIRDDGFNFKHIWNNSSVLQNVRELASIENTENPCSKCLVRYWCLSGCRGETYINKGKLNAPAINCVDLRKSILEMFWILADNSDWIKPMTKIG